jgi:acyl-CoA reductase-like NAD-dependent aldehyde dehydrogenase
MENGRKHSPKSASMLSVCLLFASSCDAIERDKIGTDTLGSDPGTGKTWATAPDNGPEDVDKTVEAAHAAFESYRKVNPRTRAQWLLKWDALIRENRDDIAKIVTYETGKPIAESQGELDYALGFTW